MSELAKHAHPTRVDGGGRYPVNGGARLSQTERQARRQAVADGGTEHDSRLRAAFGTERRRLVEQNRARRREVEEFRDELVVARQRERHMVVVVRGHDSSQRSVVRTSGG
jgi:hypothetical protein